MITTLQNRHGLQAKLSSYGATLRSLFTPDSQGTLANITLGYASEDAWLRNPFYMGALVGRVGNRIANGTFSLENAHHQLATNNAPAGIPCHLHGGNIGFSHREWNTLDSSPQHVTYQLHSPNGEEGYPGNLTVQVTYRLDDKNQLIIQARATTDQTTLINLVSHTYWNLSGNPSLPITNHLLQIDADSYLPTTPGMIPTGQIANLTNTPLDFREKTPIGTRINQHNFPAINLANGYDHAWILRENGKISLHCPTTGRLLTLTTNQPAVHIYTGNFLNPAELGNDQIPLAARTGICLETEAYPDAIHHPHFPSTILHPGEIYSHEMIHHFSTLKS